MADSGLPPGQPGLPYSGHSPNHAAARTGAATTITARRAPITGFKAIEFASVVELLIMWGDRRIGAVYSSSACRSESEAGSVQPWEYGDVTLQADEHGVTRPFRGLPVIAGSGGSGPFQRTRLPRA